MLTRSRIKIISLQLYQKWMQKSELRNTKKKWVNFMLKPLFIFDEFSVFFCAYLFLPFVSVSMNLFVCWFDRLKSNDRIKSKKKDEVISIDKVRTEKQINVMADQKIELKYAQKCIMHKCMNFVFSFISLGSWYNISNKNLCNLVLLHLSFSLAFLSHLFFFSAFVRILFDVIFACNFKQLN